MTENTSGLLPVGQAVLVRSYDPEVAASVIVIPEEVKRRMEMLDSRGIVIAIGPDAWADGSPRAKVGDKVLISKYCGAMLRGPADDKQYRMINGRDIYGVITSEAKSSVDSSMSRDAIRLTEED